MTFARAGKKVRMHHGVTAAFSLIPDEIRHGFSRQAIPCFFLGESVQRIHGAAKSVEASRAAICPGNNRRSVHFRTLRDNAGQHAAQARAHTHTTHTHTRRLRRLCNQVRTVARGRKDSCTWDYSRRRYCIATDFLLRVLCNGDISRQRP